MIFRNHYDLMSAEEKVRGHKAPSKNPINEFLSKRRPGSSLARIPKRRSRPVIKLYTVMLTTINYTALYRLNSATCSTLLVRTYRLQQEIEPHPPTFIGPRVQLSQQREFIRGLIVAAVSSVNLII